MDIKIKQEECEYCEGSGEICTECNEAAAMCECDDDEQHDECRECGGVGSIDMEFCAKCGETVDNCDCEDE